MAAEEDRLARRIIRVIFCYNLSTAYAAAIGRVRFWQVRSREAKKLRWEIYLVTLAVLVVLNYILTQFNSYSILPFSVLMVAIGTCVVAITILYYYSLKKYEYYKSQSSSYSVETKRVISDYLIPKINMRQYGWKLIFINNLVEFGDERRIDCLVNILSHENPKAKLLAIEFLVSLNAQNVVPQLKELYDNDYEVRKEVDAAAVVLTNRENSTEDSGQYTIYPFNSFTTAKKQIEKYGKPKEVIVQEGISGKLLDAILSFRGGHQSILGGFNVGDDGPRSDFLRQLLCAAGFTVTETDIKKMKIPARFTNADMDEAGEDESAEEEMDRPSWVIETQTDEATVADEKPRKSKKENHVSYMISDGVMDLSYFDEKQNSEYSIYPYNSFGKGKQLIDEHGSPKEIFIFKSRSNGFLNVGLLFEDGSRFVLGGFGVDADGARQVFLMQMLNYAGAKVSANEIGKLFIPVHFIRHYPDDAPEAGNEEQAAGAE